jgi:hypothetical protein
MLSAFLHVTHQYAVCVVLLTVTAMCRHAMERAYHAMPFIVPTPDHTSEFLKILPSQTLENEDVHLLRKS